MRLDWDEVADDAQGPLAVRIFAIEMVYVPAGGLGLRTVTSGAERSVPGEGGSGVPVEVTRQASITIGAGEGQLSPGSAGATNPHDPTGVNGFYAMDHASWAEVAAFPDWAGLRRMTELEREEWFEGNGLFGNHLTGSVLAEAPSNVPPLPRDVADGGS